MFNVILPKSWPVIIQYKGRHLCRLVPSGAGAFCVYGAGARANIRKTAPSRSNAAFYKAQKSGAFYRARKAFVALLLPVVKKRQKKRCYKANARLPIVDVAILHLFCHGARSCSHRRAVRVHPTSLPAVDHICQIYYIRSFTKCQHLA